MRSPETADYTDPTSGADLRTAASGGTLNGRPDGGLDGLTRPAASDSVTEMSVTTRHGTFAGLSFGGSGPDVLLVHDLTENAHVWARVGPLVAEHAHAVAVDMRAHGATRLAPHEDRPWWYDLADLIEAMGLESPVLVGQGWGAWGLVAATVSGQLAPSALVLLEGLHPWERPQAQEYLDQVTEPSLLRVLAQRYALGLRCTDEERRALLATIPQTAASDWTTAQIPPDLITAVLARALVRDGSGWLRQPTTDVMLQLSLDPPGLDLPFPCADTYRQLRVPTWFVLATEGVYGDSADEVEALLSGRRDFHLHVVESVRNIAGTHPETVDSVIARAARTIAPVRRIERG